MASGPDQGVAWLIALACFFINFIMAGLARTAGVIFVALINLTGASREEATTPFSIRVCVRNMTGPLIGLLGQKYGYRGVTVVGGFVAAAGSILCYFAPNIFWITMFWGVIHGFGFGLSTVLHMMVIGQYFDKYKASALGLGYSGDCFGTFAFPVIMEHLISTYGVRGTFLILGGMVLNVVPMASLLKEPPWIRASKKSKAALVAEREPGRNNEVKGLVNEAFKSSVNDMSSGGKEDVTSRNARNYYDSVKICRQRNLKGQIHNVFSSEVSSICSEDHISIRIKRGDDNTSRLGDAPAVDGSDARESMHLDNSASRATCASKRDGGIGDASDRPPEYDDIITADKSELDRKAHQSVNRSLRLKIRSDSLPPVFEKDSSRKESNDGSVEDPACEVPCKDARSASVKAENEQDEQKEEACAMKKRTPSFVGLMAHELASRIRSASFVSQAAQDGFCTAIPQETEEESDSGRKQECELKSIVEHKDHDVEHCTQKNLVIAEEEVTAPDLGKCVDAPSATESPSVAKLLLRTNTKPIFILTSVSMAVYAFLFVGVLTIIIDYAVDQGVSNERGKYLIIGFSVADLFGRLSFGVIIDRKMMKMKNYASVTMLLMGSLVAVIPLNASFNYMMVCMSMYGFVQGGTAIMFPILINMYMEKNTESVAMGCLNFYGGLLMLLMAPMIGFFRDKTGTYNSVFYIIGGIVAVTGIVWQFEPAIIKFQNRKLREKYIMMNLNEVQRY